MPRVLVIDDDAATRLLIREVLQGEGYDVVLAGDGYAGLRAVQSARPDCVLLDVVMPGLDGYAVLARIRESDVGGALPVVMLTGSGGNTAAWQAWTQGVDYYMAKPFDLEELQHCLAHLLSPVGSSRPSA